MEKIHLEKITKANAFKIIDLKVSKEQKEFVASNASARLCRAI